MSHQDDDVAAPELPQEKERPQTPSDSDHDTAAEHEAFEDAVDAASVRSLTKRSIATSTTKPDLLDEEGKSDKGSTHNNDNQDHVEEGEEKKEVKKEEVEDAAPIEAEAEAEESRRESTSPSDHISNTSNLDNVNLDDDATPQSTPQPQEAENPPPKEQTSKSLSLNSLTVFPPMPWSPPSESTAKCPAPPPVPASASPQPMARKLTSPFSWLSRNTSKDKEKEKEKDKEKEKEKAQSTPQSTDRRNTASSVATINSNPEMMLSKLDEEKKNAAGDKSNGETLKNRFKVLRMQQEAGIPLELAIDEKSLSAKASGEEALIAQVPPASPVPPPNNSLAPGTASGINAGPSALTESQVDWDIWQSVVYEGPAAVARSSAAELNQAIATGIPHAIRGVIWQVLAQSKNEDLELVYRDLVARGSETNKNRNSNSTTTSSLSNGTLSVQSGGDGVASSASSVHSENSVSSSAKEKSSEVLAKAQAAAAAERKRKEKEDAASLVKLEKTIRRDLGARTSYSKYAAAAGLQDGLFGVCKAYALFDEAVGYAQGMNFLIMPILFNMPEQEAFCLLVRLMNHYGLRDLFVQDMPGLHMHLYQFERLLEDLEPALYCHLHRRGISPHLYATQWFLTLFAYRFPLQLVLRIYDLILSEGLSAIIRFGLVLMQKNTATLLKLSDMQQLTNYLKDKLFDVYIDKDPSQGSLLENGFFGSSSSSMDKEVYRADQLVQDACELKMSPETLKAYQVEWEEKTRVEKARESELQDLRASSQSLGLQVRKLEERVEVCDREQAALATELVHTKVENDELKDENEALRAQVQDLKMVIQKQPMEIEEVWKLERDDLMKRNEKVHLENEKVEKELAELEEELVQTKLRYAEISAQHEALSRKWTDLKRQFT